ncbi:MAG: threonine synthase, partial [Desulfuromonadales bacterium]|nr:threonine synthase [Desulfuromonadales bacterium]
VVCLATAHPAKFPEAVRQATGRDPDVPPSLAGIESREKRCEVIEAETEKIKEFVAQHAL